MVVLALAVAALAVLLAVVLALALRLRQRLSSRQITDHSLVGKAVAAESFTESLRTQPETTLTLSLLTQSETLITLSLLTVAILAQGRWCRFHEAFMEFICVDRHHGGQPGGQHQLDRRRGHAHR